MEVPPTEWTTELLPGSVKGAIKDSNASGMGDLMMVPIDNIKIVAGLNVRIHDAQYKEHLEDVTISILENGFFRHKPLSGFVGKEGDINFVYCTGGFTRLEGAKRAKERGAPLEKLPVVFQPHGTNMADIVSRLDLDNKQQPLRPYEKAIVFKRLIGFGWTEEDVATKHGIGLPYVKECLSILALPTALRGLITSGKVGALDAIRLARKLGTGEALKVYQSDLAAKGALDANPLSTGAEAAPSTVTAAKRAASRAKGVPKKTLLLLIDYVLQLPTNGIGFLKKWKANDADAIAELNAYKPPRKNAKTKKATGAKRGRKAATHAAAPSKADDPFDISEVADVF